MTSTNCSTSPSTNVRSVNSFDNAVGHWTVRLVAGSSAPAFAIRVDALDDQFCAGRVLDRHGRLDHRHGADLQVLRALITCRDHADELVGITVPISRDR